MTAGDVLERPRVRMRALGVGASALVVLADAVWLQFRPGGVLAAMVVSGLAVLCTAAVSAVVTGAAARTSRVRSDRLAWLCVCLSQVAFASGILVAFGYFLIGGALPAGPTLADVGYATAACLGIVAVLFLGSQVWSQVRLRLLFDAAIAACALLLLTWLATEQPAAAVSGGMAGFWAAAAYGVINIVMAVIVLATIGYARRLDMALLLGGLGILLLAVIDGAYALVHYPRPGPLDAGFPAANLLLAIASTFPRRAGRADVEVTPALWQALVPYVPLLVAGPVILQHIRTFGRLDSFSQVLAAVSVALVLARQLMAVLETQALSKRLAAILEEQRIVVEQAPVGICRMDVGGRLLSANRRLAVMLGLPDGRVEGRLFTDFIHPDDRPAGQVAFAELGAGGVQELDLETRGVREDGTTVWCSTTAAPLRDAGGRTERIVAVVEDVSDRKRAMLRAAGIQRQLLPQSVPAIEGYELAGACRPAEYVAGDFFDWVVRRHDALDLTLADVMGHGVASALVMAVLRTALRLAPTPLGPAERLRAAAAEMSFDSDDEGLFVTLFHARLHPPTGRLRYVDAGHGHCRIRRPGGHLSRLPGRSLPLGVGEAQAFAENEVRLEPGDALLIHSDGLVEQPGIMLDLAWLTRDLPPDAGAAEVVDRLMAETSPQPNDDVTVMVLRRLPGPAARV